MKRTKRDVSGKSLSTRYFNFCPRFTKQPMRHPQTQSQDARRLSRGSHILTKGSRLRRDPGRQGRFLGSGDSRTNPISWFWAIWIESNLAIMSERIAPNEANPEDHSAAASRIRIPERSESSLRRLHAIEIFNQQRDVISAKRTHRSFLFTEKIGSNCQGFEGSGTRFLVEVGR